MGSAEAETACECVCRGYDASHTAFLAFITAVAAGRRHCANAGTAASAAGRG